MEIRRFKSSQLATSATQQKKFKLFQFLFYFLYVNWAGQMYAGQTGPKESKIQIELNLLVSSFGI